MRSAVAFRLPRALADEVRPATVRGVRDQSCCQSTARAVGSPGTCAGRLCLRRGTTSPPAEPGWRSPGGQPPAIRRSWSSRRRGTQAGRCKRTLGGSHSASRVWHARPRRTRRVYPRRLRSESLVRAGRDFSERTQAGRCDDEEHLLQSSAQATRNPRRTGKVLPVWASACQRRSSACWCPHKNRPAPSMEARPRGSPGSPTPSPASTAAPPTGLAKSCRSEVGQVVAGPRLVLTCGASKGSAAAIVRCT